MRFRLPIRYAVLAATVIAVPALAEDAAKRKMEVLQTVLCFDKPDRGPLRTRINEDHMKYVDSIKDRIRIAGPVKGPEGNQGSMLVYATANLAEAQQLLAGDPFSKNDLFARCDWLTFSQYVGTYVNGWAGPGPKSP